MFLQLFKRERRSILFLAAILIFPALFTNLGMLALYDDEGIRSLVALEMMISGNYFNPTFLGELYYNKPPLYNWILLAVFELTGDTSEFTARSVTVFFLLVYTFMVYYFVNNALRNQNIYSSAKNNHTIQIVPIASALALLTCGRILFWDSLLALIDICFSLVIYSMFMLVYFYGEKNKIKALFLTAYALASVGFLLKGLPAIVFLGLTLPTYFIWRKKWRLLFSWKHFAGFSLFVLVVGGYYAVYAQSHGLEAVFSTLYHESAKRTFIQYGVWQSVLHIFTFPFEMVYHFLPWTLLVLYFLQRSKRELLKSNSFLSWNILVLLVTIIPYWTSVEVYPRYILMHAPLLFTTVIYLHESDKIKSGNFSRLIENLFLVLCLAAAGAMLIPYFHEGMQQIPAYQVKSLRLAALCLLLCFMYWRLPTERLIILSVVLITIRLGFDWFVLPERQKGKCSTQVKTSTLEMAEQFRDKELRSLEYSLGFQPITGYYYTRETGKILKPEFSLPDSAVLYILNPQTYPPDTYKELGRLRIKWECKELVIAEINEKMLQWMEARE